MNPRIHCLDAFGIRSFLLGAKTMFRHSDVKTWSRVSVGDTIVFKESYYRRSYWDGEDIVRGRNVQTDVRYNATQTVPLHDDHEDFWEFREAIYLPRFAWRCFAEVTEVSLCSVVPTSHQEAIAEGFDGLDSYEDAFRTTHPGIHYLRLTQAIRIRFKKLEPRNVASSELRTAATERERYLERLSQGRVRHHPVSSGAHGVRRVASL